MDSESSTVSPSTALPAAPQTTAPANPANADVDFMSMLVHQLSTPLGTMRWYAELLQLGKMTTPLDAGQADMVREILLGAGRMTDLLNGIHAISRIEQNKFDDEPAPVPLADLVATIQSQHQDQIAAKRLTFGVAASQPDLSITARPSIVSLILQNLIANAVAYTPDGGSVQLTLRPASAEEAARAAAPDQPGVFISIADTGYGIPKDQQAKVFSRFFRADNVTSRGIEGTGLGLAGVAAAVTKLGGGIWFESEQDKGTTMSVVLPTVAAAPSAS